MTARADAIAAKVEAFVRTEVIPYEKDPRTGPHGPSDELVQEMRAKARAAGVLTPHILPDGSHLTQRETAMCPDQSPACRRWARSPATPMAPDEGNMYLLGKVGSAEQKERFLEPLVSGRRVGVLHDRAGRRRRRRLRSVDDEDHRADATASTG